MPASTGAVMPYDVVSPKSMRADCTPERLVDHVTMPTVGIFVLVDAVCVNVQSPVALPPAPPVPVEPSAPPVVDVVHAVARSAQTPNHPEESKVRSILFSLFRAIRDHNSQ